MSLLNQQTGPFYRVRACAKINLTLDVFSKRADGYHSLASVMQTLCLHDEILLRIHAGPGITLECEVPEGSAVPADSSNLVYRAAESALEAALAAGQTSWQRQGQGVRILLRKRIPTQAGLGGGSSDAAATLLAVNRLLGLHLPAERLRAQAASLGSDVPFFLTGGTAVARGRGESIRPLPDLPRLWLVVVKPEENVSTAWAYAALDSVPERASHRATHRMEEALQAGDQERMIAFQSNDFELPVFARFPRLAWLHDELTMAGARTVHLCGSGSALYGIAPDEAAARAIAGRMEGRFPFVTAVCTTTRAEADPFASHFPAC